MEGRGALTPLERSALEAVAVAGDFWRALAADDDNALAPLLSSAWDDRPKGFAALYRADRDLTPEACRFMALTSAVELLAADRLRLFYTISDKSETMAADTPVVAWRLELVAQDGEWRVDRSSDKRAIRQFDLSSAIRPRKPGMPWALLLTAEDVAPLVCTTGFRFYLAATVEFDMEKDRRSGYEGGTKAVVRKYIYAIQADQHPDSELVSWHWHPAISPEHPHPHIHVKADHEDLPGLRDMHLPSWRVTFEDVLLFAIRDLKVGVQEGAAANIQASVERTRRYASW